MRLHRLAPRLSAGAAIATIVSLALGTPAHAAQVELDGAHRDVLAEDVTQRCAEGTDQLDSRMAARGPHQDGWFFEVGAGTIVGLSVTFAPPDAPADHVVVTGTAGDPDSPIDFYPAGPLLPHAYVFTPAGWRLVTATAEIERGSRLILRYACAGEPAPVPTPTPTPTPTPPATPGPTPTADQPPASSQPPAPAEPTPTQPPGLAATGARVGGLVVLGTGLLAAGVAMVGVRRRRKISELLDR